MSETTKLVAEPGQRTIVITRTFDAPRHLVWEAATRPELVRRWWGPCTSEVEVCELDLRIGGSWRNVLRFPDGSRHGFHGVYKEIERPHRIVQTFVYEPFPTNEAIETAELVELPGNKTELRITILHATLEARDAHIASGMERGLAETHQRLDEVLASLPRAA